MGLFFSPIQRGDVISGPMTRQVSVVPEAYWKDHSGGHLPKHQVLPLCQADFALPPL